MTGLSGEAVGDQQARTLLAWRRTALSLVAVGVLVGHLASERVGRVPVVVVLLGLGSVVAFAWLTPGRRVAAAGAVLMLGVVLLSGLALASMGGG